MLLCSFTQDAGPVRIGVVDRARQQVIDLQEGGRRLRGAESPMLASMRSLIDAGPQGLDLAATIAAAADSPRLSIESLALQAPLPRPRQLRCFSVFEGHLRGARDKSIAMRAQLAGEPPAPAAPSPPLAPLAYKQPAFYFANRFNVIGPDAAIEWPSYSGLLDWELEIGMVIGRQGRDIKAERAASHIFGYTVFNDISAREQVLRDMELRMGPTKGKSFDTAHAMGPWIVTADELPAVQGLRGSVRLNGETVSRHTVEGMLFGFEEMIAYASRSETLQAAEVFASGTLGGGSGLENDRWLKPGDVVELEFDAIGTLRNRVAQPTL